MISVAASEELIGHVNVKTKIVHFYVQRYQHFNTPNAVIPFQLARLNEGGAFNLASGIFTVPVPGIYHFDFCAVKDGTTVSLAIYLQLNGVNVGRAETNQFARGAYETVSLSASFRLAKGDKVNLYKWKSKGELFEDGNNHSGGHLTHYTGSLL